MKQLNEYWLNLAVGIYLVIVTNLNLSVLQEPDLYGVLDKENLFVISGTFESILSNVWVACVILIVLNGLFLVGHIRKRPKELGNIIYIFLVIFMIVYCLIRANELDRIITTDLRYVENIDSLKSFLLYYAKSVSFFIWLWYGIIAISFLALLKISIKQTKMK